MSGRLQKKLVTSVDYKEENWVARNRGKKETFHYKPFVPFEF